MRSLLYVAVAACAAAQSPRAHDGAFVTCGHARFTVLSDGLVRLEHSPSSVADDRATAAIINRVLPVPPFTVARPSADAVVILTALLKIAYLDTPGAAGFTPLSLNISSASSGALLWMPGVVELGNLNGTYNSLDCYSDPMTCNAGYWAGGNTGWNFGMRPGLLSRGGWHLHDDTLALRLTATGDAGLPFWWSNSTSDDADMYFHFFGHDYTAALQLFARLAGPPPLMPRSAFGVWYSRYFSYSDSQVVAEVLDGFASHALPLHVMTLDMGWHIEPLNVSCNSWGAYDFNETLFPNPSAFIASLHADGGGALGHPVQLALNLHIQVGVDPCASKYTAFAAAMGFDTGPWRNLTLPADMSNGTWVATMNDLYLDAPPLNGTDFFWTDFGGTGAPALTPQTQLLWSNLAFGAHRAGRGKRPFVLSRFAGDTNQTGLGNHRVPAAFSGDTLQHESALAYEVTTAASAANLLVSYLSHDIGGNHLGDGCPGAGIPLNETSSELLLRWVQFGAVSSFFRTHCDKCERRPWMFPFHAAPLADAYRLRGALLPLVYTAAHEASITGLAPVRPLYWAFPESSEAYAVPFYQYGLTDAIVAAPIVTFTDPPSSAGSVEKTTWVPPGAWSTWDGARVLNGPMNHTRAYNSSEMALFVRAGTLLALQATDAPNVAASSPDLVWTLFPPAPAGWVSGSVGSGSARVWEDEGEGNAYLHGVGAVTNATWSLSPTGTLSLFVQPAAGAYPGMPVSRGVSLQVRGLPPSASIDGVTVNGAPVPAGRPGDSVGWWRAPGPFSLVTPVGSLVVSAGRFPLASGAIIAVRLRLGSG